MFNLSLTGPNSTLPLSTFDKQISREACIGYITRPQKGVCLGLKVVWMIKFIIHNSLCRLVSFCNINK